MNIVMELVAFEQVPFPKAVKVNVLTPDSVGDAT
jgi:hypothetical protein